MAKLSLTQQIHEGLQAQGLMAPPWKPTHDQLLGNTPLPPNERVQGRKPWESQARRQPSEYKVTVAIPHRGTPRLLRLCVGFLKRQTEAPYICIADTGTSEAILPEVLALRDVGVEVHLIACNGTDHAVAAACYAMDTLLTVCRTEYLWCVHSDCFVTRRTMLAELLAMADGGKNPCIGYQTIPKPNSPGFDSSRMVSHTCTLLHVPTLDDLDVTWSMRRLQRQAKGRPVELDTEMALNYRLLDRGIRPIILGPETLDEMEIDANRVHLRAATARGMYLGVPRDDSEMIGRLEKLLESDGDALPEQVGRAPSIVKPKPKYTRPEKLNLIYHVAPFAKSEVWQKNIRQIMQRMDLFNGHRAVAVSTGEGMAPMKEVVGAFGGVRSGIKFLAVPNDRTLRENASFKLLLDEVVAVDERYATFYAHAKGVATIGDAEGVMYWRNLMYHALLDDPEEIAELLTRYAVVGTHRKARPVVYPDGVTESPWHFAGSYFWFRNDALFNRNRLGDTNDRRRPWRKIPPHGWSVEAYPGLMFTLDESCCLAMPEPVNAYDPATYPAELRFADPDGPGTSAALKIELGGGRTPRGEGFVNVDMLDCADVRFNFDDLPAKQLPFDDDSAHHIFTGHCLEHVADYRPLLREIVRVGAIGCRVEIRVPHWGHNMALCYTHRHTITYEQVEHWCETAIPFWFGGCAKRLRHHSTARVPSRNFERMKARHPGWADDEIMEHVPDTCHEYRFLFNVVANVP
jgi:hypothetical protein